jgi:hypothetical protein
VLDNPGNILVVDLDAEDEEKRFGRNFVQVNDWILPLKQDSPFEKIKPCSPIICRLINFSRLTCTSTCGSFLPVQ